MNFKHLSLNLLAICWLAISDPVNAWGPLGHEVPAEISAKWFSSSTHAMLEELLPGESLSDIATWADRMRGNTDRFWQKEAGPFHYVTVADGDIYELANAPAKGDSVTALKRFETILADPRSTLEARQLALRFSVHIVGDLHQPLHVGNGKDRGGNNIKAIHRGKVTNLHRLWDSGLLYERGWNKTRWHDYLLRGIDRSTAMQWMNHDPMVWIRESQALRDQVYSYERVISPEYSNAGLEISDRRLRQSAVRIAAYLNYLSDSFQNDSK